MQNEAKWQPKGLKRGKEENATLSHCARYAALRALRNRMPMRMQNEPKVERQAVAKRPDKRMAQNEAKPLSSPCASASLRRA
jgi:hypothetical protein